MFNDVVVPFQVEAFGVLSRNLSELRDKIGAIALDRSYPQSLRVIQTQP